MTWLKSIIKAADEDKATRKYNGGYLGTIYVYSVENEPLIYVLMLMGSGWRPGWFFKCNGTEAKPDITDGLIQKIMKEGKILYTNL